MMKRFINVVMSLGVLFAFTACARAAAPWLQQLDSSEEDQGLGVAVDGNGNTYITGWTKGSLSGSFSNSNAGGSDVFLAKYDSDGNQQWLRQFGTSGYESSRGVAVDGNGNAYTTGYTDESLSGINAGGTDVILAKYDSDGNQQWLRQFGSSDDDGGRGIAVDDNGNAYITGYTDKHKGFGTVVYSEVFLAKYDSDGNQQWIRQVADESYGGGSGVAVDGDGNVYITGFTAYELPGYTNAGGKDVILAKYDSDGNQQWLRQLGSSDDDEGRGIAADGNGNTYIIGIVGSHMFLVRYDNDGDQQWLREISDRDHYYAGFSVAVDGDGNAHITGDTWKPWSPTQAVLAKYDVDGNQLWLHQIRNIGEGRGVAVDDNGYVYLVGSDGGAVLAKYDSDGNPQ